ncbi:hypothetical protein IZ6_03940 [Terrihabitans soli]|uniref:YncE family protein n=1 Tax=Terrihabitans soli TaxID=708113 RepID=A0A6S6QLB4_9HYPH|nr:hypothetical protein [Terrihabitans soli]BCJ89659.1 hypothetical protein IZ6_03940 [Terrihabitans soli]
MTKPRRYAFVAGRWDSTLTVIDIEAALAGNPSIVNRVPTSLTGACSLPVSMAFDDARGRVFVVNHGGRATREAVSIMPHGHRGTIAVIDLERARNPAQGEALIDEIDAGGHGPVAAALTPDGKHLLVTLAEGEGTEDGGYQIAVFDAETLELKARTALAHAGAPSSKPSPDASFGAFPDPNGIAISGDYVFTANGGSSDISVLLLSSVVEGRVDAEINRIKLPSGPFGICVDPSGRLLATADREDAKTGRLGDTVSIVDLAAVKSASKAAEPISIHAGTDNGGGARPFVPVFSNDGRTLYITCQAANTLSAVDIAAALAIEPGAERRLSLTHPAGRAASPRGLAMSGDGSLLAVSGGTKGVPESGVVWFVSTEKFAVRAAVAGVGNEPYLVAIEEFS